MKKLVVHGIVLLVALVVFSGTALSQEKPRIAVLEFENKAGVNWWYGVGAGAAQDIFVTELVKSGRFRVLDREKLNAILSEQDLSLTGRIDGSTAIAAGKVVGVKYFVTGALTEWEHTQSSGSSGRFLKRIRGGRNKWAAALNARVIDAETGDIVWADEASADDKKYKVTISGAGGGTDYSRNTISTLMKPMVQELTDSLVRSDF